jgi:hypothetical protein
MGNVTFLVAFIALPIFALLRLRSVTWTLVVTLLSVSSVGAFVQVSEAFGTRWNIVGLQWALTAALVVVLIVSVVGRNPCPTPWRIQLASLLIPAALILSFLLFSRLVPAVTAWNGLFADVGYFVLNREAEDNAEWLDFAGRLASGGPIEQVTILGGPLQLVLVFTATLAGAMSFLFYGGVNQVLVAADSVLYAQFLLAAASPLAIAPVAERSFATRSLGRGKRFVPAVAAWSGALVLSVMSIAATGFGHLSMQFTLVTVTLWFGAFWVAFPMPRIRLVTTSIFALTSLVWFPLAPIAFVALLAYGLTFLGKVSRRVPIDWVSVVLWTSSVILVAQPMRRSLMYLFQTAGAALPSSVLGGGSFRGVAALVRVPELILLESQGGTEVVGPVIGVLAVASVISGTVALARQRSAGEWTRYKAVAPMALLLGYAVAIATFGTWYSGSGPNYGSVKTLMLVTSAGLAVTIPVAVAVVDTWGRAARTRPVNAGFRTGSLAAVVAFAAVIFLLVVDGILPRAMARISPENWRSTYETFGEDRLGYWWPAEVRAVPDQPIESNPVACIYFPSGALEPAGGPDGQLTYSCSRILMGLAGRDAEGQPVVDWLRREWLTGQSAWTNEWPNLRNMPRDLLARPAILLNDNNEVVGLESLESLLDRYRPEWALGQPLFEARPQ